MSSTLPAPVIVAPGVHVHSIVVPAVEDEPPRAGLIFDQRAEKRICTNCSIAQLEALTARLLLTLVQLHQAEARWTVERG